MRDIPQGEVPNQSAVVEAIFPA